MNNALIKAIDDKRADIIQFLIDNLTLSENNKNEALLLSIENENLEITKIFLDNKFDIHFDNELPLSLAIESDNLDMVNLLNQYGADDSIRKKNHVVANISNEMNNYLVRLNSNHMNTDTLQYIIHLENKYDALKEEFDNFKAHINKYLHIDDNDRFISGCNLSMFSTFFYKKLYKNVEWVHFSKYLKKMAKENRKTTLFNYMYHNHQKLIINTEEHKYLDIWNAIIRMYQIIVVRNYPLLSMVTELRNFKVCKLLKNNADYFNTLFKSKTEKDMTIWAQKGGSIDAFGIDYSKLKWN